MQYSDIYSEHEIVLRYEEWSKPEEGIYNGLTVVIEAEWMQKGTINNKIYLYKKTVQQLNCTVFF